MRENKLNRFKRINEASNLVRIGNRSGSHRGCIRINPSNSYEHEKAKFDECYELAKNGKEYLTEAIFHNGKRADIIVLDENRVIEILHTEKLEEAKEKVKGYPGGLDIEFKETGGKNGI